MRKFGMMVGAVLFVAGCTAPVSDSSDGGARAVDDLPEELRAIVAPNQNLQNVRIMPEDGCYWYRWVGPVETTYLPLRTREGRLICTRPQTESEATG